jgi:amidase|tara:strand:+ start:97 stop:1527 length:1431 start_codon:yes stop_codon:yes gene_type:complete
MLYVMNELCAKTAVELRNLIDEKEISAVELLDAHLDQIALTNPSLNAIVTLVPDHAQQMAVKIDHQIAKGEKPGLLAGLPMAHKDLVQTKAIRTTFGSRLFEDFVPKENALVVQRLIDAGGITVGKTNVPEWGAGSQTFNDVFGETKNPFDLTRTCGGSSGGAAVALAARMLPLADGSDMGGSLRNPASFCNVVGFRTSPGRVPVYPVRDGWSNLSVLGPMARTVADCALMLAAITGPDDRNPISLPDSAELFLQTLESNQKGTRVAFSPDFGGQLPVEPVVQHVITQGMKVFSDLGCKVNENCPDFSGADEVFKTLRAWTFASQHGEGVRLHPEYYKETIIWNVEAGLKLSATDVSAANNLRTDIYQRVNTFFQDYDFLVLPVSQVTPFPLSDEYVTSINGTRMETYIDWMKSCYYITVTGLPAISIPCGFTPEGLPVGIQIIGKRLQDLAVLRIAYAFEQATETWKTQPNISLS